MISFCLRAKIENNLLPRSQILLLFCHKDQAKNLVEFAT